jgi:hypothetical protein
MFAQKFQDFYKNNKQFRVIFKFIFQISGVHCSLFDWTMCQHVIKGAFSHVAHLGQVASDVVRDDIHPPHHQCAALS